LACTIQTINDLAQLPDDELLPCLTAIRAAVVEARRIHSISQREGLVAKDAPFVFPSFTWRPKGSRRLDVPPLRPETPIEEIPLRASTHRALKELGILRVEDLSAISESELLRKHAIGRNTVARLREFLTRTGMDFAPNPDARERAFDESKALLSLSHEARAAALKGAKDSSAVSSLGLRASTLTRVLDQGYLAVGSLRRLSLAAICDSFTRREAREIYNALMLTGRPFAGSATPLELWRRGLVTTNEMATPTAARTPIEDLRPWLGSSVDALHAHGVRNLGSLRDLVEQRDASLMRRVGRTTADRIYDFIDAYVISEPYRRGISHLAVANGT